MRAGNLWQTVGHQFVAIGNCLVDQCFRVLQYRTKQAGFVLGYTQFRAFPITRVDYGLSDCPTSVKLHARTEATLCMSNATKQCPANSKRGDARRQTPCKPNAQNLMLCNFRVTQDAASLV
ncbi:hypothetical protein SUGI_0384700 [Cryptomeria japonica]|nr:hypothetical protein SUGI_0384700 [Cryptomeria japonica]